MMLLFVLYVVAPIWIICIAIGNADPNKIQRRKKPMFRRSNNPHYW
jgi:hypothetical protein